MSKMQKKGAGKKAETGNVVVDLGEKHSQKIDRMISSKLAALGVDGRVQMGSRATAKAGVGEGSKVKAAGTVELGRPGFSPWWSRFGGRAGSGGRPWMGDSASLTVRGNSAGWLESLTKLYSLPTSKLVTGGALGLLANRALVRVAPAVTKSNNPMLNDGLLFVAGLIPMLFNRNAVTFGVAVPGAVYFVGDILSWIFTQIGLPESPAALSGGRPSGTAQNLGSTRARLAQISQRMNAQQQSQRPLPQVVARPQFA